MLVRLLVLFGVLLASGSALAEKRMAFVVGVNAYANLPGAMQLQRAVADADAVAGTLQSLGFTVTRLTRDVTLTNFLNAFSSFTRSIEPGDLTLFFFAGHGIALDNVNYLIPSDIPALQSGGESLVKKLALAEPDLIADIQKQGARVTVMVVDACRDNPFPKAGTRSLGRSRGLATQDPPQGVFSLYSAGAGQTALDRLTGIADTNANSIFTRIFVRELKKPGVNLLDLAETVREEVAELARGVNHDQVPGVYNQMLGARQIRLAGLLPPTPIVAPPLDTGVLNLIRSSTDRVMLENFAASSSDPRLREEAVRRLAALPAASLRAPTPGVSAPPAPSEGVTIRPSEDPIGSPAALPLRPAVPAPAKQDDGAKRRQPKSMQTSRSSNPPTSKPAKAAPRNCFVFNGQRTCE